MSQAAAQSLRAPVTTTAQATLLRVLLSPVLLPLQEAPTLLLTAPSTVQPTATMVTVTASATQARTRSTSPPTPYGCLQEGGDLQLPHGALICCVIYV